MHIWSATTEDCSGAVLDVCGDRNTASKACRDSNKCSPLTLGDGIHWLPGVSGRRETSPFCAFGIQIYINRI